MLSEIIPTKCLINIIKNNFTFLNIYSKYNNIVNLIILTY